MLGTACGIGCWTGYWGAGGTFSGFIISTAYSGSALSGCATGGGTNRPGCVDCICRWRCYGCGAV